MQFDGYASVTETPYEMGWYEETIRRGAFKKTLAESPDVVLNIQHGDATSGLPIARTTSGTLRLQEDMRGLHVDADLDELDPDVQTVARKMRRGDLDGQMSFAFRVEREDWDPNWTRRTITECNLHNGDVSIVTAGANPATSSALRAWARREARNASLADRRRMAALLSRGPTVVEMRSFSLDGVRYEARDLVDDIAAAGGTGAGDDDTCNRCGGIGKITLQGKSVTCPQCRGTGDGANNAGSLDSPKLLAATSIAVDRARLALEREKGRRL